MSCLVGGAGNTPGGSAGGHNSHSQVGHHRASHGHGGLLPPSERMGEAVVGGGGAGFTGPSITTTSGWAAHHQQQPANPLSQPLGPITTATQLRQLLYFLADDGELGYVQDSRYTDAEVLGSGGKGSDFFRGGSYVSKRPED